MTPASPLLVASQIEMRVLAHVCRDDALVAVFAGGGGADIYASMAARVFGVSPAAVTPAQRTQASCCAGLWVHG